MSKSFDLKDYHTFGISTNALFIEEISSINQLQHFLKNYPDALILGKGSNVLFTKAVDVPVGIISNKGMRISELNKSESSLISAAGESWVDLVAFSIQNGLNGLENLSLIPGSVGAAPIQNIGAYGVEQAERFSYCIAIDRKTGESKKLVAADCKFGYRDSIFKQPEGKSLIVWEVCYTLQTENPSFNLSYGPLKNYFENHSDEPVSAAQISAVVSEIRRSKLPDPSLLGNAGSFFKNPVVRKEKAEELQVQFPDIPVYPSPEGVKLAAGWLIEKAGFKGVKKGAVGVHEHQALVLVNLGGATGAELYKLAIEIRNTVQDLFGIMLEPEVTIL